MSKCEHGRRKYICKDCGGSGICEHGRQKSICKECGGSALCKHDKRKSTCKECGGSALCKHDKRKSTCKECGGSEICEHGRQKSRCKECGGASICSHGKRNTRCKECGGSDLCKSEWCEIRGIPKYNGYCLRCCINICPDIEVCRNYKTKEKEVVDNVKQTFPDFTWINDKKIEGGCSKRRPDILLDIGSHIVIIEVDENKHDTYDCSCENKRLMEISQDLGHRNIVFIRFNPDGYIKDDKTITSCWKVDGNGIVVIKKSKQTEWKERIQILTEQIKYWIDNPVQKMIEIVQLFY
jgi:hypothetical protein